MIMQLFSIFQPRNDPNPNLDLNTDISFLSPEDKARYDKIVQALLRVYSERCIYPAPAAITSHEKPACVIIFRNSKSWRDIQDDVMKISSPDPDIQQWAASWIQRINQMRAFQLEIHDYVEKIKAKKKEIKESSLSLNMINTKSIIKKITKIEDEIKALKLNILNIRKEIETQLIAGEDEIDQLTQDSITLNEREEKIVNDPNCKELIKKLKKYRFHLEVFFDWPETSIDEEVLTVQVQRIKQEKNINQSFSYQGAMNASIKAIFVINENNSRESPVTFKSSSQAGAIIYTEGVNLDTYQFGYESPPPQSPDFTAQDNTTDEQKNQTMKIVKLALKTVNSSLSRKGPNAASSDSETRLDSLRNFFFT